MLGKVDQLPNDSGEILYILAEGRVTFELQHGRNAGFASELVGKIFTFVSLPGNLWVPGAVVELWDQLAEPGCAIPFPPELHGGLPGLH